MTWKAKPATTHCGRLCPARIIASPLGHWSATQVIPGRTRVIPRGRHASYFVLKTSTIWEKFITFYSYRVQSDPYLFASEISSHGVSKLFIIWKFIMTVRKNIRTSSGIIYTGSEILIPDPKISGSPNYTKNLFIFVCSVSKLYLLICVWRIQLRSGSEWLIDFINWKLRIWISRKGQTIAHSLLITKVLRNTTPN